MGSPVHAIIPWEIYINILRRKLLAPLQTLTRLYIIAFFTNESERAEPASP
jgi:hypothetical protein